MIPVVEVTRLEEGKQGSFGVLRVNKKILCYTLEPPDRENEPGASSIPVQQYECMRTVSPRFGETFMVENVPGRSHILFHAGNREDDTSGCILLGAQVGTLKGDRAVLCSGRAFADFMDLLQGQDRLSLTITEAY